MATHKRHIHVHYRAVDGAGDTRRFRTLGGARKYAHEMVGPHPEIGRTYAVSGDGVGRVQVIGATLAELFPDPTDTSTADQIDGYDRDDLGLSPDY